MIDATARRQLVRYGVVGVGVNIMGYLAFLGMMAAGLHHQLAATLMFVLAVLASYLVNRNWSFQHKGRVGRSFANYAALYFAAWLLDVLVLWIFIDAMHYHYAIVQGLAIVGIALLLFLGQRYWVFRTPPSLLDHGKLLKQDDGA